MNSYTVYTTNNGKTTMKERKTKQGALALAQRESGRDNSTAVWVEIVNDNGDIDTVFNWNRR